MLHALKDGGCAVRILINRKEFFIPLALLLRALKPVTDYEIFTAIAVDKGDLYV